MNRSGFLRQKQCFFAKRPDRYIYALLVQFALVVAVQDRFSVWDNIGFTPIVVAHGGTNQAAVIVVAAHLDDRVTPICPLPACQLIGIPH